MIQDKSLAYEVIKTYMRSLFRLAFEKVEYRGLDNIPKNGAIIFAPNHTNALIDALAVLTMKKGATVFVARADIFKNKYIAKILTFLKIMPIMRIRDGRDNLQKNAEVVKQSVDILKSNTPFCIMAEGTHQPKHSLLPLGKGIFRIAIQANQAIQNEVPVYIVPVGIEYGDFQRFRSSILMNVGEAFNVSEFLEQNEELDHAELMVKMKDCLSDKMKTQIHYVDDNEDYEAILDASYICNENVQRNCQTYSSNTLYSKMVANKLITNTIIKSGEQLKLMDYAREFADLRRKESIADENLYASPSRTLITTYILILLLALPYFIFSCIVSLPIVIFAELCNVMTDDTAMYNTFRIGFYLVLLPIILIVMGLICSVYFQTLYTIILLSITIPAYSFIHYYSKKIRLTLSSIRYLNTPRLIELRKLILESYAKL